MNNNSKKINFVGFVSFFIVLFTMPIGHAAMILMEHFLTHYAVIWSAFIMGFVGLAIMFWGVRSANDTFATITGFFGALLVWTGWIEFGYVYFANRYQVAPLIEDGKIVTKPEYLLLMSSIGFWAIMMLYYIFNTQTRCSFFVWIQKQCKIKHIKTDTPPVRNLSLITFMETNMLLWTSYIVLMFAYDKAFMGDKSIPTAIIAFACLGWSVFLFLRLLKLKNLGVAIRYAIPTVIIFWTFVEVMGRWGLFTEIWIHPLKYKWEMSAMVVAIGAAISYAIFKQKRTNSKI